MNRRSALVVALAAIAAFLLGAVAPAAAGGVTKRAVARIAATVVQRDAATLWVAHAQTAGDAATLGGSAPDSFRTHVRQYSLTNLVAARTEDVGPSPSLEFVFPGLAPGPYVVSYAVRLRFGLPDVSASCGLASTTGQMYGLTTAIVTGTYGTCTATTAVTVPSSPFSFRISASDGSIRISEDGTPGDVAEGSTVTFTPVNSITTTPAQ